MVPLRGGFASVRSSGTARSNVRFIVVSLCSPFKMLGPAVDMRRRCGWTNLASIDLGCILDSFSAVLPSGILAGFEPLGTFSFASAAKLTLPRRRFAGLANNDPPKLDLTSTC